MTPTSGVATSRELGLKISINSYSFPDRWGCKKKSEISIEQGLRWRLLGPSTINQLTAPNIGGYGEQHYSIS
jgi:hypothetical protein